MRTCVAILILAAFSCVHGYDEIQNGNVTEKKPRDWSSNLKTSVDCIQKLLIDGKSDIGLPSLNPIVLNDVTIDLSNLKIPFFKGTIRLDNLEAVDFVNWKTTHAKVYLDWFNPVVELTLAWPSTSVVGNYEINGSFLGAPFKGIGELKGSSSLGTFAVKAKLQLPTKIKSVVINPSLDSLNLELEQFFVGSVDKTKELNESIEIVIKWVLRNLDVFAKYLNENLLNDLSKSYSSTFDLPGILKELKACIKIL